VTDEELYLYNSLSGALNKLGNTVGLYSLKKEHKDGWKFLRNDLTQWKYDSSGFYVASDELYDTKKIGSQLHSKKASLLNYTLGSMIPVVEIEDFWSSEYFHDTVGNIYFNKVNDKGELPQFVKLNDGKIEPVKFVDLNRDKVEKGIFFNFEFVTPELLATQGITYKLATDNDKSSYLSIGDKKVIEFVEGYASKSMSQSVFRRPIHKTVDGLYLLAGIRNSEFTGNLLIDMNTLEYMKIDSNIRIFRNYSTQNLMHNSWGIYDYGIHPIH